MLPIRALWPGVGKQGIDVYEMSTGGYTAKLAEELSSKSFNSHIYVPFLSKGKGDLHTSSMFPWSLSYKPSIVSIPVRKSQQQKGVT
jgi:hypothetical protein